MRRALELAAVLLGFAAAAPAQVAIHGQTVHTMAGEPIRDGIVVIRDGKIAAVGPAATTKVPEGFKVLEADVVTPGLIDAHTVVGLTGYLNQAHDQEQVEKSAPIQPELRAIDAYDPDERLVEWIRGFGITTIHTGHGPLALVSGQTMIAKTWGKTPEEAAIVPLAMVAATLGDSAIDKTPGTRSKAVAMLREELLKAQAYAKKMKDADESKRPERNLRNEILAKILAGEVPLLVTAHRHRDIMSALRLAEEFKIRIVLDGASDAHLILDELKKANIPVILEPAMTRAGGERENASFETAAKLREAGIPFAFQSGFEGYVPKTRVVLFEGAISAAHGLGAPAALRALTIDAAKILGIDKRVGSLEVGKDGDVALYDGDPFEYTTHCVGTVIGGKLVFEGKR
jgi:imidazolonepropionase-like amidohydrolase